MCIWENGRQEYEKKGCSKSNCKKSPTLNSMKREEVKEKEIRIEKMSKLYTMNWVSFFERFEKSKTSRDKVKKKGKS